MGDSFGNGEKECLGGQGRMGGRLHPGGWNYTSFLQGDLRPLPELHWMPHRPCGPTAPAQFRIKL